MTRETQGSYVTNNLLWQSTAETYTVSEAVLMNPRYVEIENKKMLSLTALFRDGSRKEHFLTQDQDISGLLDARGLKSEKGLEGTAARIYQNSGEIRGVEVSKRPRY